MTIGPNTSSRRTADDELRDPVGDFLGDNHVATAESRQLLVRFPHSLVPGNATPDPVALEPVRRCSEPATFSTTGPSGDMARAAWTAAAAE